MNMKYGSLRSHWTRISQSTIRSDIVLDIMHHQRSLLIHESQTEKLLALIGW
jgi:hypothetical protein